MTSITSFRRHGAKKQRIEPRVYNSIVNKSPLSKASNNEIGGEAPSVYLKRIQDKQKLSAADLDTILRTHLIDPEHLRADDFEAFFEARTKALASLVTKAMGKPVVEHLGTNENEVEVDDLPDDGFDEDEYQETA